MPRILRVSQVPFGYARSVAGSLPPGNRGQLPFSRYQSPKALRTAALTAANSSSVSCKTS
ncbi:hypothetical protein EMIT0196P_40218 [Pseudomonas chlororaphis]